MRGLHPQDVQTEGPARCSQGLYERVHGHHHQHWVWQRCVVYTPFWFRIRRKLKALVHTWKPTMDMLLAPCICNADLTTSLRIGQATLHQSTFMMPPASLGGLGANYQAQPDAPNSQPFPMLKHLLQPPMLNYERQLAVYERYPPTLYKQWFHFFIISIDILIITISITIILR